MKGLARGHYVGCKLSLGSSKARIVCRKRPALGRNALTLCHLLAYTISWRPLKSLVLAR